MNRVWGPRDMLAAMRRAEGRARLWTQMRHRAAIHQTSSTTWAERYPELFDLAQRRAPRAARILSFGCSTGEELDAVRRRFPDAAIIGAEINPRSRKAAARLVAADPRIQVVAPDAIEGEFDIIFALAVLQRLPESVAKSGTTDLSPIYPFERFDRQVSQLAGWLRPDGLLCVMNAHYRVEDSGAASQLGTDDGSPPLSHPIFGSDGRILPPSAIGRSLFRKL